MSPETAGKYQDGAFVEAERSTESPWNNPPDSIQRRRSCQRSKAQKPSGERCSKTEDKPTITGQRGDQGSRG